MTYIGTHWIKYYPSCDMWEEDERFTNTDRFKKLLPEFKEIIKKALESNNPKEWLKTKKDYLKSLEEQYRIDTEIKIKE